MILSSNFSFCHFATTLFLLCFLIDTSYAGISNGRCDLDIRRRDRRKLQNCGDEDDRQLANKQKYDEFGNNINEESDADENDPQRQLGFGTAEPTLWCWWTADNVYWHQLPRQFQFALGVLGETPESWNCCFTAEKWDDDWNDLEDEEKQAARLLGFDEERWRDHKKNDDAEDVDFYICEDEYTLAPIEGGGGQPCLSALSQVQVRHQGTTFLKDVQVGDEVLVMSNNNKKEYQEIYSFGHVDLYAMGDFYQIWTAEDKQQPLEITGEHLVMKQQQNNNNDIAAVRADSIQVGDSLLMGDNAGLVVTKISKVQRPGLYSPLTKDGTLLVNDIVVSSYTAVQDQHPENVLVGNDLALISHHLLSHVAIASYRCLCRLFPGSSVSDERNDHGQLLLAAQGENLIDWIFQQATPIQLVVAFFLLALLFPLYGIEQLMVGNSMMCLVAAVSLGYYYIVTRRRKKVERLE